MGSETPSIPEEETLRQELRASALSLCDIIQQRSCKEAGRFLNSLPNSVLKCLFPTSANYQDEEDHHGDQLQDEIAKIVKEYLPLACEKGDVDLVLVLLNFGADPKLKGEKGSPLAISSLHNHRDIIDRLINWDSGLLKDASEVSSCLAHACEGGHHDLVSFWLDHLRALYNQEISPGDIDYQHDPVAAACKGGNVEIVANLLQEGVSFIGYVTANLYPEVLTAVLNMWVEESPSQDQDETSCQPHQTNPPEQSQKLVAKWTKKNLHVFEQTWLRVPQYTGALISIDLAHNSLVTVPENLLWGLPWLEKLVITHNALSKIRAPVSIHKLETLSLTSLNLSNNQLQTIPSEIFMLPKLEYLSLADNKLESINPAHVKLAYIPEGGFVWKCASLKRLILSHNKLIKIPADIKVARQMKKLDVSYNRLKEVPAPWDCPMEELYLQHNSISDVPDMHVCWNKTLKYLNMSRNNLSEIPWTICRLQSLLDLKLASNVIWRLPSINEWEIHNLQQLDLSGNMLIHNDPSKSRPLSVSSTTSQSSLGESIGHLLSNGNEGKKTASSPTTNGSKVTTPTDDLKTNTSNFFIGLEQDGVQMMLFPSSFHKSLRLLDLSCNEIQAVPESVCEMKSLQCLDLHGNEGLTRLPEKLAMLTQLYSLKLDPEQIKHPHEVANIMQEEQRYTAKIMKLLLEKHHRSQQYRGLKLMIVGPEKCGKTSLMCCLTGSDWPEQDKGVNITDWKLSQTGGSDSKASSLGRKLFKRQSEDEDEIMFTTWDLKGGDTYSVIHQTLFTPHTLYLLVWDVRDKEEGIRKLNPWILNIQAQAPESTIIAVGTHLDKLPSMSEKRQQILESLHKSFRKEYPRLRESFITQKGFVGVQATSANATGIRELKEVIFNCASSMTYSNSNKKMDGFLIGRKVPHAFLKLRESVIGELKERQSVFPSKPPIMNEDTLTNHIRSIPDCHMNTAKDLEEAVAFLRDTGSIIHVSDHTYGLTNLYFLDPAWLCTVLLAVVKLKDTLYAGNDGMVTRTTLQALCEESGFGKDRFDEYIQLLARFEIALPASFKRFLIPSLLPKVAPVMEHTRFPKFNDKLERWYKMAYIPPGFWSRLVSRMMVNIRQMDQKQGERSRAAGSIRKPSHGSLHLRQTHTTVWQEGIFVSFDAGQIKVEPMVFPENKPGIRVTVKCQQQVFKPMGFVVDHIETLLSEWYPGLDNENQDSGEPLVERYVPCTKCDEIAIKNEDPYALKPNNAFDKIHLYKLKQLVVLATLKAKEHVQCPRHPTTSVSLKRLLPDVFMVDLNVSYLMDDKLDIGRRLGVGGFGEVYKARYNENTVAVKQLLKNRAESLPQCLMSNQPYFEEEQEISVIYKFPQLRGEVAMMSRLKHPCIIKLFGVSIQQLSFAMEFAPLGDLDSYVNKKCEELKSQFMSERTVHRTVLPRMLTYKISHQIAMAIQYLHRMRVIHTDLKTDNVLLCSVDPLDSVNIKLADYGISHVMFGGGVKGAAGFHAFCAPEILKGKAFDEKVDWFSFGMLTYHLMSGLLPFHDLQSSIEAKAVVTSGHRPKLIYPDYTIEPRFACLEGMMNWCWMDSPADRPGKEEVLHSMRDASFLCLRHKIELDSEMPNCLYCPASSQTEMDELRQYRMWLWKGNGKSRNYTKFNVEHSAQMRPKDCPGKAITCALLFGDFHFLGTDRGIEVHGIQGTSRQRFTHLQSISVTNIVTSLYYMPASTKKATSRSLGHLFVGLQDGTVVIFNHVKPQLHVNKNQHLMQLKTLTLSTKPKPCLCMHLIPETSQLWISCGNTLRILCIQDLLLDPTVITVAPNERFHVKGLVSKGDQVWCFIKDSFQVIQYSVKTWIWVDTLHCGGGTLSKGQCLSNPVTVKHPLKTQVSFETRDDEEEPLKTEVSLNDGNEEEADLSEGLDDGNHVDEEEGLMFCEDYFTKPVVKAIDKLKPNRASMPAGIRPRNKRSAGIRRSRPYSDSTLPSKRDSLFAKVTALLVVKDTLWIGRDTGDIIVANIDRESPYNYRFGEVVAVLSAQNFLNWSHGAIRQLLPVGSDRIVACRDFASSEAKLKHQLLVWDNWGCKEVNEFEEVHFALEKARKDRQ